MNKLAVSSTRRIVPTSNRLGIVNVPESYVLETFLTMKNGLPDFITVPMFDLPEGTKVRGVWHSFENRSFQFLIENESFAEVPFGERPPHMDFGSQTQTVKVVTSEKWIGTITLAEMMWGPTVPPEKKERSGYDSALPKFVTDTLKHIVKDEGAEASVEPFIR